MKQLAIHAILDGEINRINYIESKSEAEAVNTVTEFYQSQGATIEIDKIENLECVVNDDGARTWKTEEFGLVKLEKAKNDDGDKIMALSYHCCKHECTSIGMDITFVGGATLEQMKDTFENIGITFLAEKCRDSIKSQRMDMVSSLLGESLSEVLKQSH